MPITLQQQVSNVAPADLVLRHRELCRRGSWRFMRAGLERADLEQVAAVGLVKASRRYDIRRSTPFEAYAWRSIVGELTHHVRAHEYLVRLPRGLRALGRRYAEEWERFAADFHREPSDAELAAKLECDRASVAVLRRLRDGAQFRSFDDLALHSAVNALGLCGLEETAASDERLALHQELRNLGRLERRIVVGIYWFGLTRRELSHRLGISVRNLGRIHQAALSRLRERLSVVA